MTLTQKPQIKLSFFAVALLSCVPLTLGFGVYPLLIPALLMALFAVLWIGPRSFFKNLQKTVHTPGYLLFLALLGLFFICYRGFYLPYHPEALIMPWSYFRVLFGLCLFTTLWVALFQKDDDLVGFIWQLCFGSLLFCLSTVALAMWVQKPPFYGTIIDIRYLPFGIQKFINTPGIANLLCLFPIVFLAALLLKPDQRPRWFWVLGISGYILSLIAAVTLAQRSYFVTTLIISPLIVALSLLLLGSWRPFIVMAILLASYPALRLIDQIMGSNFLYRPLDHSLLGDARFQMFQYWLERILVNPLQRIDVGPEPWSMYSWFHNFFADIHRLSGFWALLTAVILITYMLIRILFVIKRDKRFGLFLMAIFIPCFLIMNTSVVPEGERQPFLLLLALGAVAEVVLARDKRQSLLSGADLPSS